MRPSAPLILASIVAAAGPSALAQDVLIWSDEFDGPLDTSTWERQIGRGESAGLPAGWGNNELQYYTGLDINSYNLDGNLHVVAYDIAGIIPGQTYTSARLRTKDSFDFTYGRVEARIKLPQGGAGVWPAFWMLPTENTYGTWAASGEIDILESVNAPTTIYGTLHFGGAFPFNTSTGATLADGTDFSDDFHVYAIEWEPDSITWSIDGAPYSTKTSGQWFSTGPGAGARSPFDIPYHFLINIAIGGNFPGNPNGSTPFPQELLVDWIRVYQPEQTAFNGVPTVPARIQAEDFDEGYPDQAYSDTDGGNFGGAYRTDVDVDIEAATEDGFNIGWIREGEWLEYTINAPAAGEYELATRVASNGPGGTLAFERDGQAITPDIPAPVTGGWQNWITMESTIQLVEGEQTIRFANRSGATGGFNLNWFEITGGPTGGPTACSDADQAEPFGVLDFNDVLGFLTAFSAREPAADLAPPTGVYDFNDVVAFLNLFAAGCP